jgi:hypothetical protein
MKLKRGDKLKILKDRPLSSGLKSGDIVLVEEDSDGEVLFTVIYGCCTYVLTTIGHMRDWDLAEQDNYILDKPKHIVEVCEFKGSWNFPYDPDIDDIDDYKFR